MYQSVYFHRCTRGYEKLLEAIWDRAKTLINHQGSAIGVIPPLGPFFRTTEPEVEQYLRLCQYHLLSQIETWQYSQDSVLCDLCKRFLQRKGYKGIEIKERLEGLDAHDRLAKVLGYLSGLGGNESIEPRCYILEDKGGVVPYKPYRWAEKEEQQLIFLEGGQEISEALPRLKVVTKESESFTRYYCPEEHKAEIQKLLAS